MTVYLALGSNRGYRRVLLSAAVAALPAAGMRVTRVSPWYETRPRGMASRARFLNGVVAGETDLLPRVLLRRLLSLERKLGRHRHPEERRKTPRTLDLDIIFYGGKRIHTANLQLPHPRWRERDFVVKGLRAVGAPRLLLSRR